MTHLARAALVALACLLCLAPAASADYQYVAGQEAVGPNDGVCPGIGIIANAGYFRNEIGSEPRANEAFYLELKLSYFESFDCAAAFTGIRVTLPPGLNLDVGGSKAIACQRFNLATGAADPRTTANCPSAAVPPASLGASTFSLDPVATNFPESEAFGRKFWFQGYESRTNATYRVMRVLVPVKAPSAITNAPVTFTMKRFDAVNPWTASVNVTTTSTAPPMGGNFELPTLSVQNAAGQFQVSPIGVQVPFSVNKGSGTYGVSEKVVLGVCAQNPCEKAKYQPPGNLNCAENLYPVDTFDTDEAFLDVFGDYGDQLGFSPPCDLRPSTQFTLELCVGYRNQANTQTLATCIPTVFTTPAVNVDVGIQESATDARVATFTPALRGAWPAGTVSMQLRKPGGGFLSLGSAQGVARGKGDLAANAFGANDLVPWQEHAVRGCFDPTEAGPPTECVNERTLFAGAIEAPSDAAVANTTVTVAGVKLRAPNPAMTVQLRARKAADVTTQNPADLPVVATSAVGAASNPGTTAVGDLVAGGLDANTRYAWTVCAELDGDAAPEKCSPGAAFTTGAAPAVTPVPTVSATPAATASPQPPPVATTTPDTTKPAAKLAVRGKTRRRKKVTLTVTASDASGIKSVTIKVGAKRALAKRKLSVKLPSKKGKLKIVVTVTDNAGNVTIVRRTLKVT